MQQPTHIMRTTFLISLFMLGITAAQAKESCGVRAATLFSEGKSKQLAALFTHDAEVLGSLGNMMGQVGQLTNLEEVSAPRFSQQKRISVQSKSTPPLYQYVGYWINANSEKLGPVQLHIASESDDSCKLLALHIDSAR